MARFVFFQPWSTLVELIPLFFLFFKNLASIRNPAAYQAAIYARLQREYLEWRKDEDLREKARKEREGRKAAKAAYLAKPPPPGFTEDSNGYLRRIRPEEMASRTTIKKLTKSEMDAKRAGWLLRNSSNRQAAFSAALSVGMTRAAIRAATPATLIGSGAEIKAIDIALATYLFRNPATATNVVLLNGIQTGTGFFNRIGSRVEMRSLQIRGIVNSAATTTGNNLRMIVVYDRQPAGALPIVSDLLQSRDQAGVPTTVLTKRYMLIL